MLTSGHLANSVHAANILNNIVQYCPFKRSKLNDGDRAKVTARWSTDRERKTNSSLSYADTLRIITVSSAVVHHIIILPLQKFNNDDDSFVIHLTSNIHKHCLESHEKKKFVNVPCIASIAIEPANLCALTVFFLAIKYL